MEKLNSASSSKKSSMEQLEPLEQQQKFAATLLPCFICILDIDPNLMLKTPYIRRRNKRKMRANLLKHIKEA